MSKRVLCLLAAGFEEIETIAPVDLLRRAGAEVVIASITGERLVMGRSNVTIVANAELADVINGTFDLLFLPGGPGVKALRADGRPAKLAASYVKSGKPVAAICAAATVLADAGVLSGKRFTAHFSVYEELPQAQRAERIVEDGLILTSRGAGAAIEFGLALVRRLFGAAKADEIGVSIMA